MTDVVVILPIVGERVLLQLRDLNSEIAFPGCWGFFGGSVDVGELPIAAAERELFEEIGYRPRRLFEMGCVSIPDLNNLRSHSFYCRLTVPIAGLVLNEGTDFALAELKEIQTMQVYSSKLKRNFPVAHTQYIPATAARALTLIRTTDN